MAIKYILAEYNFDHAMRGWTKPKVFLTKDEAVARARRKWELEQSKYVLETYGHDTEGEYEWANWFDECTDGTIVACSQENNDPFPRYIMVVPTDKQFVVLLAHEDEQEKGEVSTLFDADGWTPMYSTLMRSIADTIDEHEMKGPSVKVDENGAYLYEDGGGFDENSYLIVDTNETM